MNNTTIPEEKTEFELACMDYLETLQKCADENIDFELGNRYLGHAQALFCIALRKAKADFCIFTGRFPELFLKFIKDDLKAALARGVKVSIVFADASAQAKDEISDLKRVCAGNLKVFRFKKEFPEPLSHFFVSDGKMYRVESPHKPLSEEECNLRTEVPAKANFNAPGQAKELASIFATISSEPLSVAV